MEPGLGAREQGKVMSWILIKPGGRGVVQKLVEKHGAKLLETPPARFEEIPEGKGLVVIIMLGGMVWAYFIPTEQEFRKYVLENIRPKQFVLMDWEQAAVLSRYRDHFGKDKYGADSDPYKDVENGN
jgi:hypothetical protein